MATTHGFRWPSIDATFELALRFRSTATPMSERFAFPDLRDLLAKANEEKSGDQLAGIAARSERERVAAKRRLADLPLADIVA
ncbi:MAG TPA: ethanolamine ammonia-lyase subunit EutB, partial [Candidatus Aquilonibacter sp.]|nr:ethanolamine ammonia-lyase subunit EutB [Candidatus Aquilonibacter sp.]